MDCRLDVKWTIAIAAAADDEKRTLRGVHPGNIHSPTTIPDNELKAQHSHPNHSSIQGEWKDDEELKSGAKGNNHYYRLLLVLLLLLLLLF